MTPSAASLLMFGVWITDPWNPTSLQPRSSITVSTMLGGLEPFAVSKTTAMKKKANQKKRSIDCSLQKYEILWIYLSAVSGLKLGTRDYHVTLSICHSELLWGRLGFCRLCRHNFCASIIFFLLILMLTVFVVRFSTDSCNHQIYLSGGWSYGFHAW